MEAQAKREEELQRTRQGLSAQQELLQKQMEEAKAAAKKQVRKMMGVAIARSGSYG